MRNIQITDTQGGSHPPSQAANLGPRRLPGDKLSTPHRHNAQPFICRRGGILYSWAVLCECGLPRGRRVVVVRHQAASRDSALAGKQEKDHDFFSSIEASSLHPDEGISLLRLDGPNPRQAFVRSLRKR